MGDGFDLSGWRGLGGELRRDREQQRIVGEHALVVRLAPVRPGRVPEEPAFDRIAQRGRGHREERPRREHPTVRAGVREEPEHGCHGELRRRAESTEGAILIGGEQLDRSLELLRGRQLAVHASTGCRGDRLPDGLGRAVELPASVHPYYVSTQSHPEFKSRPTRSHPLFAGLVAAALENQAD